MGHMDSWKGGIVRHERCTFGKCRLGEPGIVPRRIDLHDRPIGRFDLADAGRREFARQPPLQGAEMRSERARASGE
jgi:hypothetical protein